MTKYDKVNRAPGMDWINFGVTAMRKQALESVERGRVCDEQTFYGALVEERQLLAFEVQERFHEIGSVKGLREFESVIESYSSRSGNFRGRSGYGQREKEDSESWFLKQGA